MANEQERRQAELAELKALQEERGKLQTQIDKNTWAYNKFAQSGEKVGYVEKFLKDVGQWVDDKLTGKEKEPPKRDPYTNPYGFKDGPRNAYNEIGQDRYGKEGTAKLKSDMEVASARIDAIEKIVVDKYNLPAKSVDEVFSRAIEERERLVERKVPSMAERKATKLAAHAEAQQQEAPEPAHNTPPSQDIPTPVPPAHANPEPAEPTQPATAPAPPSKDTPTPQPSGEPAQPPKETKPKASFRDLFEQPALGERQTVEEYGQKLQAQHEQEFQRQMDQYYEQQPPSQPTPAPKQPGHLKDLQPTAPQQPLTETKPTSQQQQPGHFRDLFTQGEQLKDIAQGIEQMKADMDREQQGKSGPWKTPFRQLFEQGAEPPRQEQERDRNR